jgi:hypothetical protein
VSIVLLAILSARQKARATLALPLLLPLSCSVRRKSTHAQARRVWRTRLVRHLTFGLLAVIVWALWLRRCGTVCRGRSRASFATRSRAFGRRCSRWFARVGFLSLLWIVLVRPARRSNRRALRGNRQPA